MTKLLNSKWLCSLMRSTKVLFKIHINLMSLWTKFLRHLQWLIIVLLIPSLYVILTFHFYIKQPKLYSISCLPWSKLLPLLFNFFLHLRMILAFWFLPHIRGLIRLLKRWLGLPNDLRKLIYFLKSFFLPFLVVKWKIIAFIHGFVMLIFFGWTLEIIHGWIPFWEHLAFFFNKIVIKLRTTFLKIHFLNSK